jgi:predicted dehydrogenase
MDELMSRLRIAVIGAGHLGKEHARIVSGFPDVELVGVADVNVEQAEAVARRVGCPAFSNHRPLLHHADAAIIAAPTTYHHALAGEFLNSGIHLMVEKPLAVSVEQADELVELARQRQVILQVGHIERFNPAFEELSRHTFQAKFIQCERLGPFTGRSTDIGVVLDLMIHDLDLCLALAQSPVEKVEALGVSLFGGHEDVANARLSFANGCVATLSASRASSAQQRRMQVWSPEGYAGIDFARRHLMLAQPTDELRQGGLEPRKQDPGVLALSKDQVFSRYFEVLEMECLSNGDQLTREVRDFIRCVRTGERPRATGADGRDAVALADRILDSLRRHRWDSGADAPRGPSQLPVPRGPLFRKIGQDMAAA